VREENGGALNLVANRYGPAPIGRQFDRLGSAGRQRDKA
jgi:hypothetical protein